MIDYYRYHKIMKNDYSAVAYWGNTVSPSPPRILSFRISQKLQIFTSPPRENSLYAPAAAAHIRVTNQYLAVH